MSGDTGLEKVFCSYLGVSWFCWREFWLELEFSAKMYLFVDFLLSTSIGLFASFFKFLTNFGPKNV